MIDFINEVLGTDYKHLDDIPDDKLYRAYLLLKLAVFFKNNPEIKMFICKGIEEN